MYVVDVASDLLRLLQALLSSFSASVPNACSKALFDLRYLRELLGFTLAPLLSTNMEILLADSPGWALMTKRAQLIWRVMLSYSAHPPHAQGCRKASNPQYIVGTSAVHCTPWLRVANKGVVPFEGDRSAFQFTYKRTRAQDSFSVMHSVLGTNSSGPISTFLNERGKSELSNLNLTARHVTGRIRSQFELKRTEFTAKNYFQITLY